ncbi:multicopper oxidase domain-containing protein [Conservatibacter flavescens]|uniref:Cell division protein FtsP n=1 Tax=Conservatibacter flavescens TaxID=28161 RepID=A0A2M8S479_9PAST|nr:multicopper oxidase domain-containing protein [Conservatibacter flavescens]PJG85949.1 cell division protein FtsQ [Conservatibacter flavescens]
MQQVTRRQLLKTAAFSTALSLLPEEAIAATRQPLFIPPLLENRRGKPIFLSMESVTKSLLGDKRVELWGFNGLYLGPTVKVKQGDFVKLNYRNNLAQAVSLNIQGLQIPSELLGGIGRSLKPTQNWSPIVQITQPASTCWYHGNSLTNAAYETYRGLVGMWLIEDSSLSQTKLPQQYGVNDIPLILQDMRLNSHGTQLFQPNQSHFFGDRLFVNGQEAPYLNVGRGWVRLRILNASLSRGYELRCDDEREMQLIATDLGYLPQMKALTSVFVAPGERVELLIDLNEGENVSLIAGKKRGILDKLTSWFASDDELVDNTVLELRPEGLVSVFSELSHTQFTTDATQQVPVTTTREFHLDTRNAMINQRRFDPRRIDVMAKQGSTERWILTSSSPIGFRIQGAKFVVESRAEQPIPDNELSWKDTVFIQGKTQILVRFDNLSSHNFPFIFGTSDLMLSDKGCMGLIVVQ